MKGIKLPQNEVRRLPFYLALEEWVAEHRPDGDYFFAWQVKPTVICGRHQVMCREVDLNYCRENDIDVWRRKSGGGCVYSDKNNVMFSYITRRNGVQPSFDRYTRAVCDMLNSLGFKAQKSGRNDIEIDGMKVAGNAYYAVPEHSIVHGTMLYDADPLTMSRILTPSKAKLDSKGVKSVPARICTLKSKGLRLTCAEFVRYAVDYLCTDGYYTLTDTDIREVEEIEKSYLKPEFYNDRSDAASEGCRIEGVGELVCAVSFNVDDEIESFSLSGDFFAPADINSKMCERLIGIKAQRQALEHALQHIDFNEIIEGLHPEILIELILENHENNMPS